MLTHQILAARTAQNVIAVLTGLVLPHKPFKQYHTGFVSTDAANLFILADVFARVNRGRGRKRCRQPSCNLIVARQTTRFRGVACFGSRQHICVHRAGNRIPYSRKRGIASRQEFARDR